MKNNIYTGFSLLFFLIFLSVLSCSGHKIESRLRYAEELKGTRKFDEALEVYKLIVNNYPKDEKAAAAYLRMGDLYQFTFNNNDDALAVYSRVVQKWPFSKAASEAALKRAEIFKASGDQRRAIAEYEWVGKGFPNHEDRFDVMLQIAEGYLSMNDPYQAAVELEELLKNKGIPDEVYSQALFSLGESYLFLEKYTGALEAFKALEEKFPQAPNLLDVRLRMVECMEKLNLIDEAIRLQRKLMRLYPDSEIVKKKVEGLVRREERSEKPEGEELEIKDKELRERGKR